MGGDIIYVYLLIAAMVAPLIWVMWWGAGSLGRLTTSPPTIRRQGTPVVQRFPEPYAVDVTLARRPGVIAFYNRDRAEIGSCTGPDATGKCPGLLADGTVPCASTMLALPQRIRGSAEWQIPAGYRTCLVGSYDVYRRAAIGATR